ncbi:hypothetical protein [Bacillus toyonensis]|uniref:hypothetical protein n=1 Tax=Bacillus toyonensis TaxID=155322 RepID=UPI000BF3F8B4|nr:hypothetical protein [Bacillus toyonensis]PGF00867.1 hypothetical protein COM61_22695 [Bacillus toyonensis]PHE47023.1 hypothetical protein COF71_13790 [Bacillus toyonensis]
MDYKDKYWELAEKQAKYVDELLIMKMSVLESRLRKENQAMPVRKYGAFLRRLHNFNRGECTRETLRKFLDDIGELGYSISQVYEEGYMTSENERDPESGDYTFRTIIDPNKIQLTVTYKVISI